MSEEAQNEGNTISAPLAQETEQSTAESDGTLIDASTNVSQTHIGQMTESSLPPGVSGKWSCEVCTYENFPLSRKCTMCRSPKPLLGEDIFRLQEGASALPARADCGAEAEVEAVAERLRPLRISSPQAQPGASAAAKWACAACTYDNWPRALRCAMCGAAPAAPAAPTDAAHAAPPAPDAAHRTAPIGAAGGEAEAARRSKRGRAPPAAPAPAPAPPADWLWLQACLGVVEGEAARVEAYLAGGGDPARALTAAEVALLDRASAFDAGHTLVHLAIRFQREDILSMLLSRISGGGPGIKRSPSYIAPDLATTIRRHLAGCIRRKKGGFPCHYVNEFCTFSLPAEIEELPAATQQQLFAELLDREAQRTLEAEPPPVNWSAELTERLGSRLYALWNRSAGDCLPDALCQAAYGASDRAGVLRAALAGSLGAPAAERAFYARWAGWERRRAAAAAPPYALEEAQLRGEWARLAAAAARPGAALRPLHVWALAHVLRRPLLVYGADVVRSFRGEPLGYADFRGAYLPLLWEPAFCSPSPLCLGYTRGHFSALVPMEPYSPRSRHNYICREQREEAEQVTFLPLTDADGKLLPVHFLTADEMGDCEGVVRRWLRARVTPGGTLVAAQALPRRPLPVAQMLEEWLNHYRRLAQQTRGPFPPRLPNTAAAAAAAAADFSSDPDTDDE